MDLSELQDWFSPDELDLCPRCREAAALTIEEVDALLCFRCGYIRCAGGVETSVREVQGREGEAPSAS
jgi:hypothetical protein